MNFFRSNYWLALICGIGFATSLFIADWLFAIDSDLVNIIIYTRPATGVFFGYMMAKNWKYS